jgi:hypothetical protein
VNSGSYSTNNFNLTLTSSLLTNTTGSKSINLGTSTITLATQLNLVQGGGTITSFTGSAATFIATGTTFTLSLNRQSIGAFQSQVTTYVTITTNGIVGTFSNTANTAQLLFTSGVNLSVTNFNYLGTAGSLATAAKVNTTIPGQQARISGFPGNVGLNSFDGGDNTALSFTGTLPNYLYLKSISGSSAYSGQANFLPFF